MQRAIRRQLGSLQIFPSMAETRFNIRIAFEVKIDSSPSHLMSHESCVHAFQRIHALASGIPNSEKNSAILLFASSFPFRKTLIVEEKESPPPPKKPLLKVAGDGIKPTHTPLDDDDDENDGISHTKKTFSFHVIL